MLLGNLTPTRVICVSVNVYVNAKRGCLSALLFVNSDMCDVRCVHGIIIKIYVSRLTNGEKPCSNQRFYLHEHTNKEMLQRTVEYVQSNDLTLDYISPDNVEMRSRI